MKDRTFVDAAVRTKRDLVLCTSRKRSFKREEDPSSWLLSNDKRENSAFGNATTRVYVCRENPRLDAEPPASSRLGIHSTRLFFVLQNQSTYRASATLLHMQICMCSCNLDFQVNLSLLPGITLFIFRSFYLS